MDTGNIALTAYQYANKAQKNNAAGKTSFADTVRQATGSALRRGRKHTRIT